MAPELHSTILPAGLTPDYEYFLETFGDQLPNYFDPETRWYQIGLENLFHDPTKNPNVAVIVGWFQPNLVHEKLNASHVGSSYSYPVGVETLMRNLLAHPEIKHLVIAGGNISEIRSGSDAILALYELYKKYCNNSDWKNLAREALESGYIVSESLANALPWVFDRVSIHNLHQGTKLTSKTAKAHWDRVNALIESLTPTFQKGPLQPLYLEPMPVSVVHQFSDNPVPITIDGSTQRISVTFQQMIQALRLYGLNKPKTPVTGISADKSRTLENQLIIRLPRWIDPTILPESELVSLGMTQEELQAYLVQFTEEDSTGIAAYTYGETIASNFERLITELTQTGQSNIQFLTQPNILAQSPDCLNNISFSLTAIGELDVHAYIRSNSMHDAWPKNALGIIYLAHKVAKALGDKCVGINGITTYSESGHIRDTGIDVIRNISVSTSGSWEIAQGEAVRLEVIRTKNGITIGTVGDDNILVEIDTRLTDVDTVVPKLINALTYKTPNIIAHSPEQVIRLTIALTKLFSNTLPTIEPKHLEAQLDYPITDAVYPVRVWGQKNEEINIKHVSAALANRVMSDPSGYMVGENLILPRVALEIPWSKSLPIQQVQIDQYGIDALMSELMKNIYAKGAVFVGDGSQIDIPMHNFQPSIVDSKILASIHQIQFLTQTDGSVRVTAIVDQAHYAAIDQIVAWINSVANIVMTEWLSRRDQAEAINTPADNLRIANISIQLTNLIVDTPVEEVAQTAEQYRVPTYVEDLRGAIKINKKGNQVSFVLLNSVGTLNLSLDIPTGVSIMEATYQLAHSIVIDHQWIQDPGHIAYLAREIYKAITPSNF